MPSQKFQFSLKCLLAAIIIISAISGIIIYAYEPHLIEVGRYPISVDYSRTLEEMIAAGKYDYVNPDISSTNFPINKVKSGTENLEAMIFYISTLIRV